MAKRIRDRSHPRSSTGLDLPVERKNRRRDRCCFESCHRPAFVPSEGWEWQFALCEHHLLMAYDDIMRAGGVHKIPLRIERDAARRERERADQDAMAARLHVPVWSLFASRANEGPPEAQTSQEPNTASDERATSARDGVVYYLRIGGYIKIGWTSNLAKRMRSYSPDSVLLATEPGPRSLETRRHKMFAAHRTHGREWYSLAPALTGHIDRVKAEHGEPDPVAFAAQPVTVPQPRPKQYVGGNHRGSHLRGEIPTGKSA